MSPHTFIPRSLHLVAASIILLVVQTGAAEDPRVAFATERLCAALADPAAVTIHTTTVEAASESYTLQVTGNVVYVTGADPAGILYGCLDLARRVQRLGGRLPEDFSVQESPALSLRGTCIFLMKLGSYDYPVTPQEFPFFYDKAMWLDYLDFLVENRFNYIAFWNGHPFDYFVKLEQYPEAQSSLSPQLLEENHDTLLWLATEAEKRNIWLMFQFYNIHTSPDFARAHGLPLHGNSAPTPLLAEYTSYCIEKFVSEFPSIGLYICPGEALRLQYTDGWINDVILPAVNRTGRNPPIMIRAWGIDLPHMAKVAGHYTPLYTERKYNVEMLASDHVDPENLDWSKMTGQHVVNVHCIANLEPFRWSPPSYIQRCLQSSRSEGGATGLHLYPRKAWRWPYGCDLPDATQVQWKRDWMWFEAWSRYAWNPDLDPGEEQVYWRARLTEHFGDRSAAEKFLASQEAAADVLPGLQRLIWLGGDNHTVLSAGILLPQMLAAPGAPFLRGRVMRIPTYLAASRTGKTGKGTAREPAPAVLAPASVTATGAGQVLDLVAPDSLIFTDRAYTFGNAVPPEFIGLPTIRFSNDEGKRGQARIRFRCDEPVRVFVAFNRPNINWADPPADWTFYLDGYPFEGVSLEIAWREYPAGDGELHFPTGTCAVMGFARVDGPPPAPGQTPVEFMAELVDAAETALSAATLGAARATRNTTEAAALTADASAVLLVARFYQNKLAAALAYDAWQADASAPLGPAVDALGASLQNYRQLTALTRTTYESMSDVPMWYPIRNLGVCPFHWSDMLPYFESEYANLLAQVTPTPTTTHTPTITPTPTPTSAGRGDLWHDGWRNSRDLLCFSFFWQSDETPSSAPADLVDDGVINQEDLLALAELLAGGL